MSTFIIQVNPTANTAEEFVIYNSLDSATAEQVRQWAYEGDHGLHPLRVLDEDDVFVEAADSEDVVIRPCDVTGVINELPEPRHRRRAN